MDDAFTYTCEAFELAEGGATVFEVKEGPFVPHEEDGILEKSKVKTPSDSPCLGGGIKGREARGLDEK